MGDSKKTVLKIPGKPKKDYYSKDKNSYYMEYSISENEFCITIITDNEEKVYMIIKNT